MKTSEKQPIFVEFPASIPATENAIKIAGDGGARLILDISENNMGAFLMALPMRGKKLLVRLTQET